MSILTKHTPWPHAESSWDYGATRLLAMLREQETALTLEQARARGIEMPAQAIYALRLAGYVIDRVPAGDSGRRGYRLGGGEPRSNSSNSSWTRGATSLSTIDQGAMP